MFDKLLGIASIFDWISPAKAAAEDLINGPGQVIHFIDDGSSVYRAEAILSHDYIKTWGRMTVASHWWDPLGSSEVILTIPKRDSKRAVELLQRARIIFW